jgi:hypothetical protein
MDDSSEIIESTNEGFFKFVFDFNDYNKNIMMNMVQYTVLSLIPILLVLTVTRNYVPEVEENKGNLELLGETLLQIVFIIISFWFINRVIVYIPTYSGMAYKEFNETTFLLGFVFILMTIQTKLGDKIRILADRAIDLWNGNSTLKNISSNINSMVTVKQPLAGGDPLANMVPLLQQGMPPPPAQMTNLKAQTNEHVLPQAVSQYQKQQHQPHMDQNSGYSNNNYDKMHKGPNQPLINAALPGLPNLMEPMAANEMGGGFGSAW